MNDDFKSCLIEVLTIFTVAILLFFTLTFVVVYGVNSYQCNQYQNITGIETKTGGFECYVNTGKAYIPYDEYKLRSATHRE